MRSAPPLAALALAASFAAPTASAGAAPATDDRALLALAATPEAHAAVVIPSTHAPALSSAPTGAPGTGAGPSGGGQGGSGASQSGPRNDQAGDGKGDPGAGQSDPGADQSGGHQSDPGAADLIADADPTSAGRGAASRPSATLPSVRKAEHAPPTIADPPATSLPRTGFDDWLVALTGAGLLLTGTGLRLRISRIAAPAR